MSAIEVDVTRLPVIQLVMPEVCSVTEIEEGLDALRRAVAAGSEPLGLLLDTRKVRPLSFTALHRQVTGDGFRALRRARPGVVVANAIVLRDGIVRGIAMAVMWISPPSGATELFTERGPAEAYLRAVIERKRGGAGEGR